MALRQRLTLTAEPGDVAPGARSDLGLVIGIARGQSGALRETYRRHASSVYCLASVVCERGLAEEVVQEAFLELWRTPEAFDPGRGSLRACLLVLAWRRAVARLGSGATRQAPEAASPARGRAQHDVDGQALGDGTGDATRHALLALPIEQAEAVILAFFGDQGYREVAKSLGRPEGTVGHRIRTGLIQLRAGLIQEGPIPNAGTARGVS